MKIVIDIPDDDYEYIKLLHEGLTDYQTTLKLYRAVKNGTVEDRPIGHWIEDIHEEYTPNHDTWECSNCREPYMLTEGTPDENKYNYCPNCGADMRGKVND